MQQAHKRSRNPKVRKTYRVKNWSEYDRSLRARGDITFWFSEEAIGAWAAKQNGRPGRQRRYSALAIETVLTLRLLFHLPLRQAEGFVDSIVSMMNLTLPIPDHTTLSRLSSSLKPVIDYKMASNEPVHLVVDSTGPFHTRRRAVVPIQVWE